MPNRYLIANWKMNLPPEGIESYLSALDPLARSFAHTLIVAPPFPYIDQVVRKAPGGVAVGAQNCADQPNGAFTGEVSAPMLAECGVRFVIVGHSERRSLFHESDALVARKLAAVIGAGLTPVLCVGEDLRVRDEGLAAPFIADQIKAAASETLAKASEILIAYEPVWAIGTGRNASGALVADTVEDIRDAVQRFWPARHAAESPILYGGSVTPENIEDLAAHGRIDGFLVGGASLDSARFGAIGEGMRIS